MSIYDFKHQEVYYVDEDTWENINFLKMLIVKIKI